MDFNYLKKLIICIVPLFICSLASLTNAGSRLEWIKISPEIFHNDASDFDFGFTFNLNPNDIILMDNEYLKLHYILKGEWANDRETRTDPIEAKINLTYDKLLLFDDSDIYWFGQLGTGYISDDRFEEMEFNGGITLAFFYEKKRSIKLRLFSNYNLVYSFESKYRELLGKDDEDNFSRLDLESEIILRLGNYITAPILSSLKVSADYRYFFQYDLDNEMERAGEDQYDNIKLSLTHEWWKEKPFGVIQEVFISYSNGHLPTQTQDQALWSVGFVLYGAEE